MEVMEIHRFPLWGLPGCEGSFAIPFPVHHVSYVPSSQSRDSQSRSQDPSSRFQGDPGIVFSKARDQKNTTDQDGRKIWGDPEITLKRHKFFKASLQDNNSHENRLQRHSKSCKMGLGIMRNPASAKVDLCNGSNGTFLVFQSQASRI